MKWKILILAVIVLCCCGFFFWYRTLRPKSETDGLFPMTLSGVCVEHMAPLGNRYPQRMDVYLVNRTNGKCDLVVKNVLVTSEKTIINRGSSPLTATCFVTVAVNPVQAYKLTMAQKEGYLELAHARFEDPDKTELPRFTLEDFLGEKTAESPDK
jgi:hypothetical protein